MSQRTGESGRASAAGQVGICHRCRPGCFVTDTGVSGCPTSGREPGLGPGETEVTVARHQHVGLSTRLDEGQGNRVGVEVKVFYTRCAALLLVMQFDPFECIIGPAGRMIHDFVEDDRAVQYDPRFEWLGT